MFVVGRGVSVCCGRGCKCLLWEGGGGGGSGGMEVHKIHVDSWSQSWLKNSFSLLPGGTENFLRIQLTSGRLWPTVHGISYVSEITIPSNVLHARCRPDYAPCFYFIFKYAFRKILLKHTSVIDTIKNYHNGTVCTCMRHCNSEPGPRSMFCSCGLYLGKRIEFLNKKQDVYQCSARSKRSLDYWAFFC